MLMRFFSLLLYNIVLVLATPASAAWRVAETAHFRLYGEQSESVLRERVILLEDFSNLLGLLTTGAGKVEGAPPLDVFLVDKIADATPFRPVGKNIADFYITTSGRIAAFSETGAFGQLILLHEYTHHFMLGQAAVAYPRWYVEGFAEYFATAVFKTATVEFGGVSPGRAMQLVRGVWLPFDRLIARDPMLKSERETSAFYAQSWLLAHYLLRMPGQRGKLTAYLRAVAGGADSVAAFKEHVDPNLQGFDKKLRHYIKSRDITYSKFDRPAASAARVTITTLPKSADAVLMKMTALELGRPPEPDKALADTRAAAAKFPGDPLAERTLALAELQLGDRKTAATMIDALLARAPEDATLLRWRALALDPLASGTNAADRAAARRLLVRSFRADPADWRTMLIYLKIAGQRSGPTTGSDLDVALRARELTPQVPDLVITTAPAPIAFPKRRGRSNRWRFQRMTAVRQPFEPARNGDKPGFLAVMRQPAPVLDESD
jgi:hypothetical protein